MTSRSATIFSSIKLQRFQCNLQRPLLLFLCVSSAALADDRSQLEYGKTLRKEGHAQEACRVLREVQRRNPRDVLAVTELGIAYMTGYPEVKNSAEKAESCFRRAIELSPQYGRAYALMGECLNSQARYTEGIEWCTKALSVKHPDTEALIERAAAYSSLKRDKEALVDIELVIKKEVRVRKRLRMQKATILENLKMFPQALAEYRTLLKESYQDGFVMREVACLQALNRNEEALKSLNGLLSKSKTDDVALLMRARLYEKMGKHKEAVSDYTKALDSQPSTTALNERATVYDKIGRKDLAEKDRREAARL